MLFFDSQREGYLPLSTSAAVPWRGPAFTADYNTTVTLASSLPNGTLDGFGVRGGQRSRGGPRWRAGIGQPRWERPRAGTALAGHAM